MPGRATAAAGSAKIGIHIGKFTYPFRHLCILEVWVGQAHVGRHYSFTATNPIYDTPFVGLSEVFVSRCHSFIASILPSGPSSLLTLALMVVCLKIHTSAHLLDWNSFLIARSLLSLLSASIRALRMS